jgi:hypothetical protein
MTRRLARHPLDFFEGRKACPRESGEEYGVPGAAKNTGADACALALFLIALRRGQGFDRLAGARLAAILLLRGPKRRHPMADPLDEFIAAAAAALQLPLEPDWQAAVKANLAVTLQHANFVAGFALPDEAEPAPIYKA